MNACPKCGQLGVRDVTHVCMNAMGPPSPSNLPVTLDTHHWLYKAGYEEGYAAAVRERDLSPLGRAAR